MKKRTYKKNITGYIEGYYGKLLSWENREFIIKSLFKEQYEYFLCSKRRYKS